MEKLYFAKFPNTNTLYTIQSLTSFVLFSTPFISIGLQPYNWNSLVSKLYTPIEPCSLLIYLLSYKLTTHWIFLGTLGVTNFETIRLNDQGQGYYIFLAKRQSECTTRVNSSLLCNPNLSCIFILSCIVKCAKKHYPTNPSTKCKMSQVSILYESFSIGDNQNMIYITCIAICSIRCFL